MSETTRLCFVCLGNIIRSPLSEHVFRQQAKERGVDQKYVVDSAGTASYHVGEPPDARMRRVAAGHGLEYSGRARQFQAEDFDRFDLIVAMDSSNRRQLQHLAPDAESRKKIRLMREFDPEGDAEDAVPDPYYGGIDGFETTYQIVVRSVQGLLDSLEEGDSIDP